ncbi:glutathione peroxidase [Flavobacterium oreochromis]|uniref:Glutathione peroxidase n=2 Tax=Flavobacterium TaxID=237 RepID=A0A2D0AHI8_9FLAO|nr:glutathione peroxidase [Flavobacterium oreochromis]OWP75443.1 glutathione peroxidase [Flavobacterium oreochromis]OWP75600.1 glutathione peroxidase [Flavobacterium oreochromis]POR23899.1 glutathione peroxidase [Flavobacterium columnare]QYS85832.1 glutathione peroxidase [Flavobacterium oreochromis]
MKKGVLLLMSMLVFSCKNQEETLKNDDSSREAKGLQEIVIEKNLEGQTIYQYQVIDVNGKIFDFSKLRGKKIMIVNTATDCGFTDQLELLQQMYVKYKRKGLEIVAFPSNDFGDSEPLENSEINAFCKKKYGVTFPIMAKVSLKGSNKNPVYQFLMNKNKNGLKDNVLHWNFQKYLINESGHVDQVLGPHITPDSPAVLEWIKS